MDVKGRIKQYLEYKSISDYRFEKELSLSKGYINKAKNPTSDVLIKMCGIYTDISTEWLLRGEGEMLKEGSQVVRCDECSIIRERVRELLKHVGLSPTSLSANPLVKQKIDSQINGEGAIGADVIYIILEKIPSVSAEWLMRGEGEMLRSSLPDSIAENSSLVEELKAEINMLKGENRVLREQVGLGERKGSRSAS